MHFALVNDIKMAPEKGLRGKCPGCGSIVIAKCGNVKAHHWAHDKREDCDKWWEPMTQWHLNWQEQFPKSYREIVLRDSDSGEFHRADVHTPNGITIEFQHSSISADEIDSRNAFYKKLIWVVDGTKFNYFEIGMSIPDPNMHHLNDYNFLVDKEGLSTFGFLCRKSEITGGGNLVQIRELSEDELRAANDLYKISPKENYLFQWKYKHKNWLWCSAHVFFDFGGNELLWLKKRDQIGTSLRYIKKVKKSDFLAKYTADHGEQGSR